MKQETEKAKSKANELIQKEDVIRDYTEKLKR